MAAKFSIRRSKPAMNREFPENQQEYRVKADELRNSKEFESAGDVYTLLSYNLLEESELEKPHPIGDALNYLLTATLCYRLSNSEKANLRAKEGILVAEEAKDHIFEEEPRKGLCFEFIGDFELVGDLKNPKESYENAEKIYDQLDESMKISWLSEPEFGANYMFACRVSKSLGEELDPEIESSSTKKRIKFKKEKFPELIEKIIEENELKF